MSRPFIDPEVPLKLFHSPPTPTVMKLVHQSLNERRAGRVFWEMIDRNAILDATRCHINLRGVEGVAVVVGGGSHL